MCEWSKARDRIEIDFAMAMERALELEEIAGHLTSIAENQVGAVIASLPTQWRGDNAEIFLRKGSRLEPELLGTAEKMLKAAKNIRLTAEIIYQAEKLAIGMI